MTRCPAPLSPFEEKLAHEIAQSDPRRARLRRRPLRRDVPHAPPAGSSSTRSRRGRTTPATSRSTRASRASSSSSCAPSAACRSARRSCCAPRRWRTSSAISGPAASRAGRTPAPCPGVALHLYGKKEPRPGRKMGHLTALADDAGRGAPEASSTRAPRSRARFESETSMKNPSRRPPCFSRSAPHSPRRPASRRPSTRRTTSASRRASPSPASRRRRRSPRSRRPASGPRSTSASRPRACAAAREAVEAQGLKFLSVPVSPDTFSLGDVKKVEAVLKDPAAAPVLLFCCEQQPRRRRPRRRRIPARAHEGRGDRRGEEGRPEERRHGEGRSRRHGSTAIESASQRRRPFGGRERPWRRRCPRRPRCAAARSPRSPSSPRAAPPTSLPRSRPGGNSRRFRCRISSTRATPITCTSRTCATSSRPAWAATSSTGRTGTRRTRPTSRAPRSIRTSASRARSGTPSSGRGPGPASSSS